MASLKKKSDYNHEGEPCFQSKKTKVKKMPPSDKPKEAAMTIIRSKVSQNFTIISNSVLQDKDIDSKYLGTFMRLISKSEDWEISISGLASLYPTNGVDFYRSALKHLCKLGYLIRLPQERSKGQFQKVVMELYDSRQVEVPLDDEVVENIFSKEGMDIEEIQKIYPKRIFQHGGTATAETRQQRIDYSSSYSSYKKNKRNNNKQASPAPAEAVAVFSCLEKLEIPQNEKEWLSERFSEEEVSKALKYCESPNTVIKTSFIATLKWACKVQPEIPESKDPETKCKENHQKMKEVIGDLDGKSIKTSNGIPVRFEIFNKYFELVCGGQTWKLFEYEKTGCIEQAIKFIKENFPTLRDRMIVQS